jgi:pyruvate formate lyase activating enzyme
MSLKITNIQRFSLHDGPGIRTTVFLKGCLITCPWCCNPENLKTSSEFFFKNEVCIGCEECIKACPISILKIPSNVLGIDRNQLSACFQCRECIEACPTNSLGIYGETINSDDLLKILEKDTDYYSQTNGGVTFSGGEPLLQIDGLTKIIKRLNDKDINIAIETSLFAPPSSLKIIEDYVDLFIVDIKILDSKSCETVLKSNLDDFKTNFKDIIKNKQYVLRFPLVKELTFNEQNINSLINVIRKYDIQYLEIFCVHDFGSSKYGSLGLKSRKYELLKRSEIDVLMDKLEKIGVKVKLLNL